jgi:hypothetical protein
MNGLSQAIVVCKGELTDPTFSLYLARVKENLQRLLQTGKEHDQLNGITRFLFCRQGDLFGLRIGEMEQRSGEFLSAIVGCTSTS